MATKRKEGTLRRGSGQASTGSGQAGVGAGGKAPRIIPNKHRKLQIAPTRRKLFGEKDKSEFLEWFAATCNCSLSARKVGFHYRTVLRHWREDPAFGERCEEALRMGYPRLEELALRAGLEALSPKKRRAPKGDRTPPEEHFRMDPMTAVQLLREHKRQAVPGWNGPGSGRGGKRGQRPRVASNAEVKAALEKRLKAFYVRERTRLAREAGRSGDAPESDA
jgi:hypothetical protein